MDFARCLRFTGTIEVFNPLQALEVTMRGNRRIRTYAETPLTRAFFIFSVDGVDIYAGLTENLPILRAWDMMLTPNL